MIDTLVLGYHAVSERWPASLSIPPDDLAGHVALLASRGYRGVTFHEAVTGSPAAKRVAITFDDAYRSVVELAFPILSEARFPATVFAPTAFIGKDEPMSWPGIDHWLNGEHRDELTPMSWEELERLAAQGWEIGSHTRSHPHLPELDQRAIDRELRDSRQEIERRLGACRSLAYPYGDHDRRVVDAARRAGYDAAGTLPARLRRATSRFEWPRIVVTHADDAHRFRWKVSPLARRVRATPAWSGLDAVRRWTRRAHPILSAPP